MATHRLFPLFSLLWFAAPVAGRVPTELNVTCGRWEECILPCQFLSDGKGARIMWYKRLAVVSCTRYGNTSWVIGHNSPADMYRGRTELYSEKVLEGNATLVLRNVTPHDQGKYYCVTMTAPRTDQSGVITLSVKAPVEEVGMEFTEDTVVCKAEDVYPEPKLSWSVDPSEGPRLLRNKTTITTNALGFFDIESWLMVMDGNLNRTFICSISSDGKNRTSFLRQEELNPVAVGDGATLRCHLPPVAPRSFNLTWRLTHWDPILSMRVWGQGSRVDVEVRDRWKAHVSYDGQSAERLTVKDLAPEHQGIYTCEMRTAEETYITKTRVVVIADRKRLFFITIILLVCLLIPSYAVMAYLSCKRKKPKASRQDSSSTQDTDVSSIDNPQTLQGTEYQESDISDPK